MAVRLNKYMAHAGVCNRNKAVDIVKKGEVMVNGMQELNPFYEVKEGDLVTYKGKTLIIEEKKVYLLINKPKDMPLFSDPAYSKPTVQDLLKKNSDTALSPVYPLPDDACGLMVWTNDKEVLEKANRSDKKMKAVYQLQLETEIAPADLISFRTDFKTDSPYIAGIDVLTDEDAKTIGIELLRGNVEDLKKIFEDKGYQVKKIDRTFIAGLTKKDLKRGWSRHLTEKEVIFLKYF